MSARDQLPPLILTFLVVDIIAVGLRVWIRTHVKKSFGYDDAALCAALLGFVLLTVLAFICLSYGYGAVEMLPGFNATLASKYFLIAQLVYMITLYISKLSVALVLFRLAEARRGIRVSMLVSMVVLTIWTGVTVLTVSLQCRPLRAAWGEVTGDCVSGTVISNTGGIQISLKLKVSVLCLLGLGVVSNIATLIRLKYLMDIRYLPSSAASTQLVKLYLDSFIYSVTEIGLTIFTASLAALRPLLTYLVEKTSHSNGDDSHTTQSRGRGWKMELRDLNPPIQIHDHAASDNGSQADILPQDGRIVKHTSFDVKYSEA